MPTPDTADAAVFDRRSVLTTVRGLLRPYHRRLYCILAALALAAATEPALAWTMKAALDWQDGAHPYLRYWMLPLILLAAFLLRGLATFGTAHLVGALGADSTRDLQRALYAGLLDAQPDDRRLRPAGRVVHLLAVEVKQYADLVERVLTKLVRHCLTVTALFGYLIWLDWRLGLVALSVLPPFVLVGVVLGRRIVALGRDHIACNGRMADLLMERMQRHRLVQLHAAATLEMGTLRACAGAMRTCSVRLYAVIAAAAPLTQLTTVVLFGALLSWCMHATARGMLTVGEAAAFATNLLLLLTPLKNLAELNGPLLRGIVGLRALHELLAITRERGDGTVQQGRAVGRIACERVTVRYGAGERAVLEDCDLAVEPGEFVAIVGQPGAGKSTLLRVLAETVRPTAGRVLLDDRPAAQWQLASLRRQIAAVDQEVHLVDATIARNIAYGDPEPDLARVAAAAACAQLATLIASLPDGLDSLIGPRGEQLSGGQKQQLALARAVYRDAPILLLDEPTAALDADCERQVVQALAAVARGKTVVVVTHRPAMLALADRILVLAQGRVCAAGTHEQLLRSNPYFRSQFGTAPGGGRAGVVA